jgi:multiple antibiotic resistance protein
MHEAIAALVRTSLLILAGLFPLVNSPENIPIFLMLTAGLSTGSRAVLARKIAVNSFALLIVSVLIGTHILAFFGISVPVVEVGGGLVVIAVGWKLLNRPDTDDKGAESPKLPSASLLSSYLTRRAFYPLTMQTERRGARPVGVCRWRRCWDARPWRSPSISYIALPSQLGAF